jgi:hypothetical protein
MSRPSWRLRASVEAEREEADGRGKSGRLREEGRGWVIESDGCVTAWASLPGRTARQGACTGGVSAAGIDGPVSESRRRRDAAREIETDSMTRRPK